MERPFYDQRDDEPTPVVLGECAFHIGEPGTDCRRPLCNRTWEQHQGKSAPKAPPQPRVGRPR